jgi:hypothetical protein
MRVYVNGRAVDLFPGMTVRHALVGAGCPADLGGKKRVYDEWGNELGLEGALSDGMKIYVR